MPSLRARWMLLCPLAAASLLFPTSLSAQGATGRIVGRVSDPSGAVLAGVKVIFTNQATGVTRDHSRLTTLHSWKVIAAPFGCQEECTIVSLAHDMSG